MAKTPDIRELLLLASQKHASDLHLTNDTPPVLRINGCLTLTDYNPLDCDTLKKMVYGLLSDSQKEEFEKKLELDFSVALPDLDRFRANVHMQRGCVEVALRRIPLFVPSIEELGLPDVVLALAEKRDGLILITGPTGTGKTTTLAAIIDLINSQRSNLIICVEDPIEYIHINKKSIIKQREVFNDTHSFSEALKRCLRQDPDVIVVGEMRDLETISTALTAAETGHLVFATLHTPDAPQTIERIIDVFPPYQQEQVKIQLSSCLNGVLAQRLLPRKDGSGRVLATEVMIATSGIRHLIREQAIEQIPTAIQTGQKYGMKTMDKSLQELYQAGVISCEVAIAHAKNPEEFQRLVQ
jgi:twitching motility protein PilT